MSSRHKGMLSLDFLVPALGFLFSLILVHTVYQTIIRPAARDFEITSRLKAVQNAEAGKSPERSIAVILKDPEQEVEMIFWLWATIVLGYKLRQVGRERALLAHDFIGARPGERIIPEDALDRYKELKNAVESSPAWRDRLLPDFLLAALHRFHATRSVQDAASAIKERSEMVADEIDSNLSMIRYVAWAIPAVGFIGTVRGIGDALAQADQAIKGDLSGVTSSLGLAFNSTLVALILSMVLMLMLHMLQQRQEALVLELQSYCRAKLIDIMKVPAGESAPACPMSHLGLELSDAGFQAAHSDNGQLRAGVHGPLEWPALVSHDGQKYAFGREAEDQWYVRPRQVNHAFWSRLSREASTLSVGGKAPTFSQLGFFFLRDYLPRVGGTAAGRVVLAVPGAFLKDAATEDEKIGLLLGMAGELKLPLVALVDQACAALCDPQVAYFDPALPVIVVDLHLHGAELTLLRPGPRLTRRDFLFLPQQGHAELLRHLTTAMGNRFLRHTTFDILEDGRLEQLFYRQTKDFLLARAAEHHFQINTATHNYQMTATRDQLISDSAAQAQALVQAVQTVLQNNALLTEPCTVALTARAGLVPGIRTRFRSAGFNRLVLLPAGAAAQGAARLAADHPPLSDLADAPVVTHVPVDLTQTMRRAPWEIRMLKGRAATPRPPTHVITDGVGRALDGRPVFVIGLSPARPDLALPESFNSAGEQCQVRLTREGNQVWWHENAGGDSVGRTAVQAGDRLVLRCGDAEVEVLFASCRD